MPARKSFLGTALEIYVIPMALMLLIIAAFQVSTVPTNSIGKGIAIVIGKWPVFATYSHAFFAYLMIAIIGAPLTSLLAPFATRQPIRRRICAAIIGFISALLFYYMHWLRIHPAASIPFFPYVVRAALFATLYMGFSMMTSKWLDQLGPNRTY